jgi:DNA-binding beta-propeller fold protein YncE
MSSRCCKVLWTVCGILLLCLPAAAQKVLASVNVGYVPSGIAVNPNTKKVYVANECGTGQCGVNSTVTVIDEQTLQTTSLTIGISSVYYPVPIAVNKTTNKIFVATCGTDLYCDSAGVLTVIDGATLATTNVPIGTRPTGIAVNEVTNKIFVVNACGNTTCAYNHPGTLTIIDGATLATTTMGVQFSAYDTFPSVAVNPVTNEVYVLNPCGTDDTCWSDATVMAINPVTLANSTVNVGKYPVGIAVNSVTNKIYVANSEGEVQLTVIDGATLSTTGVTLNISPVGLAINPSTNEVYVTSGTESWNEGEIAAINGNTLTASYVVLPAYPGTIAVNSVTNKVYIPNPMSQMLTVMDGGNLSTLNVGISGNSGHVGIDEGNNRVYVESSDFGPGTVTVVDGNPPPAWQFVPVTPCRVVDTRNPDGTFGGPPIAGGSSRDFPIPQGSCDIPSVAAAYSLNVTVVPHGSLAYLTIWPTGQPQPLVSTMNSLDGRIKANAAIVADGTSQAVSVYASDTTDVVLDINGYFVRLPSNNALAFYPLTPCRVADTRNPAGPLGGPSLQAGQPRDFPVLQASGCNIPTTAAAYSMNFTAVPRNVLAYLTVWPTGLQQPAVSTLNDLTGTVVANAAIVPAGTNGDINTYATNDTDLVIDINGYFAPPGANGLSLYAPVVCRVLDSRTNGGQFMTRAVGIASAACSAPSLAGAYVLNATAIPSGSLGYLTLWPATEQQPLVSTLNAPDGAITSNMAIVPNVNGTTNAFASNYTQLILDISGYFAP